MTSTQLRAALLAACVCCAAQGVAQNSITLPEAHNVQTETDEYTRYELLDPATASFKIYYEVTATTAGAKVFYNPIRKGSVASDESVYDAMSGAPLQFQVVSGPRRNAIRCSPMRTRALTTSG